MHKNAYCYGLLYEATPYKSNHHLRWSPPKFSFVNCTISFSKPARKEMNSSSLSSVSGFPNTVPNGSLRVDFALAGRGANCTACDSVSYGHGYSILQVMYSRNQTMQGFVSVLFCREVSWHLVCGGHGRLQNVASTRKHDGNTYAQSRTAHQRASNDAALTCRTLDAR